MQTEYENRRQTLASLYETYEQTMYRVAFAIVGNVSQAEDCVQDAFVKIVPHLHKLKDAQPYERKAFLLRIVRNTAIDCYRKNKNKTEYSISDLNDRGMELGKEDPLLEQIENRDVIRRILSQLDPIYREILQYRCFYDWSYEEISEQLQITPQTAMKRFQRAREMVKRMKGGSDYAG